MIKAITTIIKSKTASTVRQESATPSDLISARIAKLSD